MAWILLEAFIALLIGVAIVWWTMAPKRKSRKSSKDGRAADGAADNRREP